MRRQLSTNGKKLGKSGASFDIDLPGDNGPIFGDFGQTPVRLNPDSEGEVVWAKRLCPVRARIYNIPFRDSGFNYGDIVLHDGAETGEREWQGHIYPVFNVLEVHEKSPFQTFVYAMGGLTDDMVIALREHFSKLGAVEDWSHNVRILCKQCSEGTVHESCDTELGDEVESATRRVAIAAKGR